MEYKDFLLRLRAIIMSKLPDEESPARILSPVLGITPRAVNNKLKGEILFSVRDLIKLNKYLNISPASLSDPKFPIYRHPMELLLINHIPENESNKFASETIHSVFSVLKDSGYSKFTAVCRSFPILVYNYYEWLMKFAHLKSLYFNKGGNHMVPLCDITRPDKYILFQNAYVDSILSVKRMLVILDSDLIINFMKELLFFHNMGYITPNEMKFIVEDLDHLIRRTEAVCESGYFRPTGVEVDVYYSDIPLTNDLYLLNSDLTNFVIINTQGFNHIVNNEPQTYEEITKWVDSWLRCSHPISNSAELDRKSFFEKQYHLLEEFKQTF